MPIVLATNRPEDLDPAVLDRIDVTVHIDLPGAEERRRLVKLYHEIHFESLPSTRWWTAFFRAKKLKSFELKDSAWNRLAVKTEGFSGREISKLFVALYNTAALSSGKYLNEKILDEVLEVKRKEHQDFMRFITKRRDASNNVD